MAAPRKKRELIVGGDEKNPTSSAYTCSIEQQNIKDYLSPALLSWKGLRRQADIDYKLSTGLKTSFK